MSRWLLALLLAHTPLLLAEEPPAVPQAVAALRHLAPKADAGPFSWTAGPYGYDGSGNIASIGSESFVYDKLGRLKSATVRGPDLSTLQTQTFGYDVYGNLTSTAKPGQTVLLPADPATNRLGGVGYDASGNISAFGTQSYDYDALGMLNTVRLGSSQQPRIIYAYTADDERLFSFDVSTGTTHWTLRGFDNKVLRDLKQQGTTWSVERDYVYRDGLLLAALKPGGSVEHYSLDHLGTPRLVTDGSGNKIGYHVYWPYGEEWSPGNAQEASPLKFTGHERDTVPASGTAGLDYMHARYYRAQWGRFLSVDPTLDSADPYRPQGWNRNSYARSNPLRYTDPDGRIAIADDIVIVLVVGTALLAEAHFQAPSAAEPDRTNAQVMASSIAQGLDELRAGLISIAQHVKGARPSTKEKHQKGQGRRAKDRGGEKGDDRRRPPRIRPKGHKGPYPAFLPPLAPNNNLKPAPPAPMPKPLQPDPGDRDKDRKPPEPASPAPAAP